MEGTYAPFDLRAAPLMEAFESPSEPLDVLIDQIKSGDLQAFDALMQQTEARVLGIAWRVLGDRELARDAAQETFLRVYRSLDSFRHGENFQAWIAQITVNACRDLARKRGPVSLPVEHLDELAPAPSDSDAEASLLRSQQRTLVRQALATLPPGERTALVLRDLEGFSTEDVARVLGVRPVTIRTQIASARAKLRAHCDQLLAHVSGGRP